MDLPDSIILRADEKVVKNSAIFTWVILCLLGISVTIIVKPSLDSGNMMRYGLSLFIVVFNIWIILILFSVDRKQKRQLRNQTILYTITKNGITDAGGNTYVWSNFKKIYYYKSSVHLLEKDKLINAIIFSSSSIDPKAFKEACLFIKQHAPPETTKGFKPR